jgi:hypothetical protein
MKVELYLASVRANILRVPLLEITIHLPIAGRSRGEGVFENTMHHYSHITERENKTHEY